MVSLGYFHNMYTIRIIEGEITKPELRRMAEEIFGDMVKGTADITKDTMALGGEMHIDSNQLLLDTGSEQQNVWGFNIYPDQPVESWIEYNSLVNIKPVLGNRSPDILDASVREKIKDIVLKHVSLHE